MLMKLHNLGFLMNISSPNGGPTFHDLILTMHEADFFPSQVIQILQDIVKFSLKISLKECEQ
jgi:hypothetical protein